jgi:hypothetical protein
MNKKLFTCLPSSKSFHKVRVGTSEFSEYSYICGYYEAGKVLALSALNNGSKNMLFYPICFNYRHYLELHLKSLIVFTEELYRAMKSLGYITTQLDISDEKKLDDIHSIEVLFHYFEKRLAFVITDEVFDTQIKKYIMQLHNMDPNGQIFRYHMQTDKKLSFPTEQVFDLKNIAELMKEIHALLEAVDGWIDHHIQLIRDMEEYIQC